MAILTGIFTKLKGSLGQATMRQVNGQTVASEKPTHVKQPRTLAQMELRIRLANLVHMWSRFNGNDRPSFESKPRTWSDNNAFINANLTGDLAYLTKSEADQGGCVVVGYQITRGSLPSITVSEGANGFPATDISLGSLTIDENTTLADFSNAVIENNEDYQHGDQITCFVFKQSVNTATNVPVVTIKSMKVVLNVNDTDTALSDVVDADGFSSVNGYLGRSSTINGGIAWVHSRKSNNGTKVSTQFIFVSNTLLSQYQSQSKRIEAALSYGATTDTLYLTPQATD